MKVNRNRVLAILLALMVLCTNHAYRTVHAEEDSFCDLNGHSFTDWRITLEPTCTEPGQERSVCDHCTASASRSIAALGHDYAEGVCTRCGETDPNYIEPVDHPFTDVEDGDYFLEPVMWAVAQGITHGTSANTFSPNNPCTRAQIVTFLWRAKGSPEPLATVSPFDDVIDPDDYYYKAVLWACENGITAGVSKTRFAPADTCTRGQVMTFLHRAASAPACTAENPFNDVPNDAYYYDAVLWAYENNITSGVSEAEFAPNDVCTRGQIVTFLFRAQSCLESGDMTETNMQNWDDYFEIETEEEIRDHGGRLVPNRWYYLAVKDGSEWKRKNFEEIIVTYRYNVKCFYYTIGDNGEITMDTDAKLVETKDATITLGRFPVLLAEKGVHGHTSAGRFFVHLPTDVEIIRVSQRVYTDESLDHYITFESNGLISAEQEQKIRNLLYETYPKIFEYFADGQYEKVSCTIEVRNGVASTAGRNITVSADYLNQHPNDLDCITHELVHCAQAYPNNPIGWLTEGIADYGRYLFGLYNEEAGWKLPAYSQNQSYTDGYRVTAAFLKYVVENYEAEMVRILNAALQNDAYSDNLWKEHTGYTVDELWELYAKDSMAGH